MNAANNIRVAAMVQNLKPATKVMDNKSAGTSSKKKFLRTGTMKQLRSRKQFTKKSVILREQKLKAAYSQKLLQEDE